MGWLRLSAFTFPDTSGRGSNLSVRHKTAKPLEDFLFPQRLGCDSETKLYFLLIVSFFK